MATETLPAPLGAPRLAGASKGVALTTSAAYTTLPLGTRFLSMVGRNYSTAVVARWTLCPWLTILKTTDLLATNVTDLSTAAQDGSTGTTLTLSSMDTLANTHAIYIGAEEPFGGLNVDVQNTNSNAATIAVTYWDGTAWTNITPTDNTASAGATFAQDGTITWSVPTAWVVAPLKTAVSTAARGVGLYNQNKYWVRVAVSAALDASVTLNSIIALEGSTAYAELISSQVWEQNIVVGNGGYSSVVALTDAGTANLIINCSPRGRFA